MMGFTSKLYRYETIIDDSTPQSVLLEPDGMSKGLRTDPQPAGEGYQAAVPFPAHLMIPESEWQARIQEREERKTRLSDLIDQANLPCKDQNGTNY